MYNSFCLFCANTDPHNLPDSQQSSFCCRTGSRAPSVAAESDAVSGPQASALVVRFSLLRELDCSELHGLPLADLEALAGLPSLRSLSLRGNYRTGAAELQQGRFQALSP